MKIKFQANLITKNVIRYRFIFSEISPIHEYGVQSLIKIKANKKIIEYTGERIDKIEKERRDQMMRSNGDIDKFYFFQLNSNLFIDGTNGNISKYINHSCNPNCIAYKENNRIFYYSTKLINEYEELTVDYGAEFFDDGTLCRCKSLNCRNPDLRLNTVHSVFSQSTSSQSTSNDQGEPLYTDENESNDEQACELNKKSQNSINESNNDYDYNDDEQDQIPSIVKTAAQRKVYFQQVNLISFIF